MPDRIVQLSRPLKTHQGEKTQLVFREPTARDYIAMRKLPFGALMYQETRATRPDEASVTKAEFTIDYEMVFLWAERLSGVEFLILETLKGPDVPAIVEGLRDQLVMGIIDQTDAKTVDDSVKNLSASSQT